MGYGASQKTLYLPAYRKHITWTSIIVCEQIPKILCKTHYSRPFNLETNIIVVCYNSIGALNKNLKEKNQKLGVT